MKYNVVFNGLFLGLLMCACPLISKEKGIIVSSIPKSGTHMLARCLYLLTGLNKDFNLNYKGRNLLEKSAVSKKSIYDWNKSQMMLSHLPYDDKYIPEVYKGYFPFFIYRDPRDQLVSLAFWVYKRKGTWKKAEKLSLSELITYLITDGEEVFGKKCGINGFYNLYMPWTKDEHFCVTTFEKLVGPRGGGQSSDQKREIRKIAKHLGIVLSEEELLDITGKIFGEKVYTGSFDTFRKGQIGSWKEHFSETHRQLFKEHAGQLLIDLGYEKDLNW